MVVVYRLAPLTYRLFRPFVHLDTFAMVNLVAGRTVASELIQQACTPRAVAREALRLLTDREAADTARRDMAEVRARLGAPGATRRAAEVVLRVARAGKHAD
jgi:lipid-A-disaccharide synthase